MMIHIFLTNWFCFVHGREIHMYLLICFKLFFQFYLIPVLFSFCHGHHWERPKKTFTMVDVWPQSFGKNIIFCIVIHIFILQQNENWLTIQPTEPDTNLKCSLKMSKNGIFFLFKRKYFIIMNHVVKRFFCGNLCFSTLSTLI